MYTIIPPIMKCYKNIFCTLRYNIQVWNLSVVFITSSEQYMLVMVWELITHSVLHILPIPHISNIYRHVVPVSIILTMQPNVEVSIYNCPWLQPHSLFQQFSLQFPHLHSYKLWTVHPFPHWWSGVECNLHVRTLQDCEHCDWTLMSFNTYIQIQTYSVNL